MSIVAIIDYGMGNLDSVVRAIEECGGTAVRAEEPRDLREATHIILPGVGAFGDAMASLRASGMVEELEEQVLGRHVPFIGVCLGMQLLAREGFEGGTHKGLGWLDAEVRLIEPADRSLRVPHVGWNNVFPTRESPLFDGIEPGKDFYFVHSYHLVCENEDDVLATTPYGADLVSVVNRGNIFAAQFHPEKSQTVGLRLLSNFLEL